MTKKKLSTEAETPALRKGAVTCRFDLSKYLKSKGFRRLNRNQSHPSDCKHKYRFIHSEIDIEIVQWDDESMTVGLTEYEFDIPESEAEFKEILKKRNTKLLAFLNGR